MQESWWGIFATFGASLVPGMDLRLGIPIGAAMGVPVAWATLAATAGNVLQIGLIAALMNRIYSQAGRWPRLNRWITKVEAESQRYERWIRRYGWVGLLAFVIVPLPGTGVVGGVVLARLLRMPAFTMWSAIATAVMLTGLVFGLGTHGTFRLLRGF